MNIRHRISTIFFLSITLLLCFAQKSIAENHVQQGALRELQQAFSDVIQQARPAVVYLQVTKSSSHKGSYKNKIYNNPVLRQFFGDSITEKEELSNQATFSQNVFGSGFFIDNNGYIVTNSHIIRDAEEITVILPDRTQHKAKIIGSDKEMDVAVLKINGSNYPFLPFANSNKANVGDWVLAVGSPFKYMQTVTAGIISATSHNSVGISGYEHFIQTDAAINPGNSGGPLLNIGGEVVGINTAFMTRSGGYMGVGFAIPSNIAQKITRQLIATGTHTHGWIGLSIVDCTTTILREKDVDITKNLAKVVKVYKGAPADKVGLKIGDLLSSLNGEKVTGAADFHKRILLYSPGDLVKIGFYRNNIPGTVNVTLEEKQDIIK